MYRHDRVAAHAHIECLQTRVGDLADELAAAKAAGLRAESEVERLREGIGDDPDLVDDVQYRRTQRGLRLIGLTGLVCFITGVSWLLAHRIGPPMWSWQGVENFWFHVTYGDALSSLAMSGGIAVLLSPWLVLPWLGAIGLRRQRRWGWVLGVVGALLFLPTPLMPVAAYTLTVLFSGRVRALYFPRP